MAKKKDYLDPKTLPAWARAVYGFCFGGDHHWGKIEAWGNGFKMNWYTSGLGTWDFNHMTRMVLIAHKIGVRVEVIPLTFRIFGVVVHKRPQVENAEELRIAQHHPTLEQHMAKLAESLDSWEKIAKGGE